MSVSLRHKRFPFVMIYRDPKESWDDLVGEKILEEIRENGFDNFVVTDDEQGKQEDEVESR